MTDKFKGKAKDWDVTDRIKQLSAGIGSSILKNVAFNSTMHVMDFGAGTGLITSQVAPFVNKITAVDISQAMLDQLIAKQELKDKVQALCQDITSKPTGEKYDLIMSAMAMHHVKGTDNMVKQFAAHLKSGGKVALADLDKEDGSFHPAGVEGVYHSGFERSEFLATLEKHGFKDVRFETAHTVQGDNGTYPVFLALATKA